MMMISRMRFPKLLAFMVISLSVLMAAPAYAGKKKKKSKKAKKSYSLTLNTSLDITYDDNVINYSDDDLDRYDVDNQDEKFAIESTDDWIFTPRLEPRVKGRLFGRKTAWLELDLRYYFFAKNDVKRYFRLAMTGRHYIYKTAYTEIEYAFFPDYYYRNQYYTDGTGPGTYLEASFRKHYLRYELGMNLKPSLKGDISYRYQKKTFNEEFSWRDLTVHGIRLDGIWNASRRFKFWVFYGFEDADAAGADIQDNNIKDVSYDAWDITFGGRYYAGFLSRLKPEFVSTFKFRQIRYQTLKINDIYRFGREDNNYYLRFGLAVLLLKKIRLEIDFNAVSKRVASIFDDSAAGLLEYDSNSVSFRMERGF